MGATLAAMVSVSRHSSSNSTSSITRFEQIEPSLKKEDIGEHPLMLGDDIEIKDKTALELVIPVDKIKNGAAAAGAVMGKGASAAGAALGAGATAVATNKHVVKAGQAISSAGAATGKVVYNAAAQTSEAVAPHLNYVKDATKDIAGQAYSGAAAAGSAVYEGAAPALANAGQAMNNAGKAVQDAAGLAGKAVQNVAGASFAQASSAVNGWISATGWFGASEDTGDTGNSAPAHATGPQASDVDGFGDDL